MPMKRTIILQCIFAFCVICLVFIVRQANHTTSDDCQSGICPKPSLDDLIKNTSMTLTDVDVTKNNTIELGDHMDIDDPIDALTALEERPAGDIFSFTIVTAASANHFCALESMLYTLRDLKQHVSKEDFPRLVVYDLGTSNQQKAILDSLKSAQFFDELVVFDYQKYPSFWNVSISRGEYAWKTGIVKEVQVLYGGVIVWLDTGDVPNTLFMHMVPSYIRRHGFWSPRSTGFVGSKFNHEGVFQYYKTSRKEYGALENCNGAALGFDADNKRIVDELITPWYECGLDKDCIAPPGSSRSNHRQDQSAITLLAVKAGYRCFEYPEFHGITIHQDDVCLERLKSLEGQGIILHPSFIGMLE